MRDESRINIQLHPNYIMYVVKTLLKSTVQQLCFCVRRVLDCWCFFVGTTVAAHRRQSRRESNTHHNHWRIGWATLLGSWWTLWGAQRDGTAARIVWHGHSSAVDATTGSSIAAGGVRIIIIAIFAFIGTINVIVVRISSKARTKFWIAKIIIIVV